MLRPHQEFHDRERYKLLSFVTGGFLSKKSRSVEYGNPRDDCQDAGSPSQSCGTERRRGHVQRRNNNTLQLKTALWKM